MSRKMVGNQTLDSSIYLELSDREAESVQGGQHTPLQKTTKLQELPSPIIALVLLFANPFS